MTPYTEQAIRKSIEGGYERYSKEELFAWNKEASLPMIFMDKDFWKCLGKAEGWDEGEHIDVTYKNAPITMYMWQWKWHSFIDHLAEGKEIELFFNQLLQHDK